MFGLEFLFGSALLALPLAGVPILLHLLFRRKSPLVPFSTLRFIKSSIQQTAARKRVHRWLLLACRVLLLALLIWAVSQPYRKAAGWFGNQSITAVIVVDTSYSMELQDHQTALLTKANDSIDELLRGPLQNARVAIYTSQPTDTPETFQTVASIQQNWRELKPQPALVPLADRIAQAAERLKHEDADHRWLIVISDMQRREFPQPLPDLPGGKIILLDLHPDQVRVASIVKIATEPAQPRLGIKSQVNVEVAGWANDSRAVDLSIAPIESPDKPTKPSLPMANLNSNGRADIRAPVTFDRQSWMLLTASLQASDDLPWASSRTQLVKIPPPAIAAILQTGNPNALADRNVRWALDPFEGKRAAWPITVRPPGAIRGDENIIAANLTQWPDAPTARKLTNFVRLGGSLVLFVQPGLEQSWAALSNDQKTALLELLPGTPISPADSGPFRGSIARPNDLVFSDFGDEMQLASGKLLITRIVSFDITDSMVQTILNVAPNNPALGSKLRCLLARRKIGTGNAYTWATLPTQLYGNLLPSEFFLPVLVNTSIRPEAEIQSLNIEVGNRIILPGQSAPPGAGPLDLVPPQGPPFQINPVNDDHGKRYISDPINDPGLYSWKMGDHIVAYTNVQYPAAEAQLEYRPATEVAVEGPSVVVARSMADLQTRMQKASEPVSRWTLPIAIVMFLLCLEALMGNLSKSWKPVLPRFFTPKMAQSGE